MAEGAQSILRSEFSFSASRFCCSVLQWVTFPFQHLGSVGVCYSVLQSVAVSCSELQCVAVCCSVLQCVAVTFVGGAQFTANRESFGSDSD